VEYSHAFLGSVVLVPAQRLHIVPAVIGMVWISGVFLLPFEVAYLNIYPVKMMHDE
jgi:hypothetical protein